MVDAAEDEEADDEDGGAGEEKAGALRVERAAHQELLVLVLVFVLGARRTSS